MSSIVPYVLIFLGPSIFALYLYFCMERRIRKVNNWAASTKGQLDECLWREKKSQSKMQEQQQDIVKYKQAAANYEKMVATLEDDKKSLELTVAGKSLSQQERFDQMVADEADYKKAKKLKAIKKAKKERAISRRAFKQLRDTRLFDKDLARR